MAFLSENDKALPSLNIRFTLLVKHAILKTLWRETSALNPFGVSIVMLEVFLEERYPPDVRVLQLARALERRGLAELTIPVLSLLQVWGGIGAQLLWMFKPFVEHPTLVMLAEILEEPDMLQYLKQHLSEGAARE